MRFEQTLNPNCLPGIQLAHAGRKVSTDVPWPPQYERALLTSN
jgi:hypothetical protein